MCDKLRKSLLRWFGHVPWRPATTLMRKSHSMQVDGLPRKRWRLKRMLMEVLTFDLSKCNLSKDLAQHRLEWRNKTHAAGPT